MFSSFLMDYYIYVNGIRDTSGNAGSNPAPVKAGIKLLLLFAFSFNKSLNGVVEQSSIEF